MTSIRMFIGIIYRIERSCNCITWMNEEIVYARMEHTQHILNASYVTNSDLDI